MDYDSKVDAASDDDDAVLETALKRFRLCEEYYAEEYERAESDTAFLYGAQWPEEIVNQRQKDGQACLTENRLLPFAHRVMNGLRQNMPSIVPRPADSGADVEVAEILKGIIKNIEVQSDAESAYDTAAISAVAGGYGFFRIITDYCDGATFNKEIKIERILNPFSVYLDPTARRKDLADACYGFIFDDMPTDEFKEKYPDAVATGFNDRNEMQQTWFTDGTVRIAEYFYCEEKSKRIVLGADGAVYAKEDAEALGIQYVQEREIKVPLVKWCKMTAQEILERTEWEGNYIPIVAVLGEEIWADGRRKVYSLIHPARDPQMMFNYWKTAGVETIALQPKVPFIGAVGSFDTDADKWATANRKNYAHLEYDIVELPNGQLAPPPMRAEPPAGSLAMLQEASNAAEGIKAALGMYDASLGASTGGEISGSAIFQRERQGDLASYHFTDNMVTALKHAGRILVDLIPKVYSDAQILRIMGDDGEPKMVAVNQPFVKDEDGNIIPANGQVPQGIYDLRVGKYDIVVDAGASYATRRQEAVEVMIELLRVDPRLAEICGDLIVRNLDIPDAQTLSERIRANMNPALLEDNPMAAQLQAAAVQVQQLQEQLAQQEILLQAKQQNTEFDQMLDVKKLELEAEKIQISAAKTQAEIMKMQGEMQKNPSDIDGALRAIAMIAERVEDLDGAVSEILTGVARMADNGAPPQGETPPLAPLL